MQVTGSDLENIHAYTRTLIHVYTLTNMSTQIYTLMHKHTYTYTYITHIHTIMQIQLTERGRAIISSSRMAAVFHKRFGLDIITYLIITEKDFNTQSY